MDFATSAIGEPIERENENPALNNPQNIATASPFLRLNSGRESTRAHSRSFITPASPFMIIPKTPITTPVITINPPVVVKISRKVPETIGGISVPKIAHVPSATATPSPSPRYRIVSPYATFPKPHIPPNRAVSRSM